MTLDSPTRRTFVAGTFASAGALAPWPVHAQTKGRIVMAAWGGGVGDVWREAYVKGFSAKTGIGVTINEVIDPSAQVRAQADAPQHNAAIATYVDAVNLYKAGLLETFAPEEFTAISAIPEQYRLTTPEGRIIGMPAYFMYYGIALRSDEVRKGEIASWRDLGDPKWKGRIAVTGPLYGSTYDLTMTAYAAGSDERNIEPGLPIYKAIAANAMTVYSNMAQMNQMLTRGEIVGGAYYSARIWQMQKAGISDLEMIIPKEGPLMLPYMVVVPKGTFDVAVAKQWLDYISSPEPQRKVTELSGYFPFNLEAKLTADQERKLGMNLDDLRTKLVKPDWFVIAADQQRRADIVEQITSQAR
jgi:putative spermidine/putrescine transport system substrate-binding protein